MVVHEGDIHNTAVVADNDFMWHRVRPLGRVEDGMVSLSLDDELRSADGQSWTITGPGGEVAGFDRDALRVSLSWKATVFSSEDERRRHDEHLDDLDADEVLRRLAVDLAERDLDPTIPDADPFRDPDFVGRLQDAYLRYPV